MVDQVLYKPKQKVKVAGFYVIVDRTGAQPPDLPGSEYALSEEDDFPPTPRAGLRFRLARAAHHVGDAAPPADGEPS